MKWLRKLSFYKRIQFFLLILIILPLAVVSIVFYSIIKNTVITKVENSHQNTVDVVANDIGKSIEDILYASNLFGNPGMSAFEDIKSFRDKTEISSSRDYATYKRISDSLNLSFSKSAGLNPLVLYINNKDFVISSTSTVLEPESVNELIQMNQSSQFKSNRLYWLDKFPLYTRDSPEERMYNFAVRVFTDIADTEIIGKIFIGIPDDYFEKLFSETEQEKYVLMNQKEDIIYQYPNDDSELNSGKGIQVKSEIPNTDWTLALYSSYQEITGEISKAFGLYAIYLVLNVAFFLMIAVFISRSLSHPLHQLRNTAEQFGDGNLDIRFPVSGEDEIAFLGNSFNHMLDQIKNLIQKIKSEQEEKRKIELQALFAQIEPHFLINTMNSLKCNLILSGEMEHSQQVDSLIRLLRAYMRIDELSTIQRESEIMKDYVNIMEMRVDMKIGYEINIESHLEDFKIPRLTLQPIIENSIIHGFTERCEHSKITIDVREEENKMAIYIKDNGKGIEQENLMELKQLLKDTQEKPGEHVGLKNTYQRLILTYGADVQMNIDHNKQGGVIVEIKLPMS